MEHLFLRKVSSLDPILYMAYIGPFNRRRRLLKGWNDMKRYKLKYSSVILVFHPLYKFFKLVLKLLNHHIHISARSDILWISV